RPLLLSVALLGVLGLTTAVALADTSWGRAIKVPGLATLSHSGAAHLLSISCAAARSCAAGGNYSDGAGHTQAYVVNKTNGVWRKAVEVPGLGHLNVRGNAEVVSISCGSAHSCAAGGFYSVGFGVGQGHAFVTNEKNG